MLETGEYKTQYEIKADPFTFVFRELDTIHRDITELKADINREITELKADIKDISKRIDETNKRIDSLASDMNKRFDKLYVFIIATFIGTFGTLIKLLFF
jgi:peptidoglycan hydrolase CwlO-like protein